MRTCDLCGANINDQGGRCVVCGSVYAYEDASHLLVGNPEWGLIKIDARNETSDKKFLLELVRLWMDLEKSMAQSLFPSQMKSFDGSDSFDLIGSRESYLMVKKLVSDFQSIDVSFDPMSLLEVYAARDRVLASNEIKAEEEDQ